MEFFFVSHSQKCSKINFFCVKCAHNRAFVPLSENIYTQNITISPQKINNEHIIEPLFLLWKIVMNKISQYLHKNSQKLILHKKVYKNVELYTKISKCSLFCEKNK